MKLRLFVCLLAFAIGGSAGAPYPGCLNDCDPVCNTSACQPPKVPCPEAGPPWC